VASDAEKKARLLLVSPFRLGRAVTAELLAAADVLVRRGRWKGAELKTSLAVNHGGLWALSRVKGEENPEERLSAYREELERSLFNLAERLDLSFRPFSAFSLSPSYRRVASRAFVELFERGLLNRESVVAPWCDSCLTVLDPDRKRPVRTSRTKGREVLVRLKGAEKALAVLFPRPELLGACVGLAINPSDKKLGPLNGKAARLPLYGREVKIVATERSTGEGVVRPILPAYDQEDLLLAQSKQLAVVDVLDSEGKMGPSAGRYSGLSPSEARERIVKDLAEAGALGEARETEIPTSLCEICGGELTFRLAEEWFVDLSPLKDATQDELEKRAAPPSFLKTVSEEGGRGRWCISRRSPWGVELPVWFCSSCDEFVVGEERPERCAACGSGSFERASEKFSAGFLAALWPLAAAGWGNDEEEEAETSTEIMLLAHEEGELAYLSLWLAGALEPEVLPGRLIAVRTSSSADTAASSDSDEARVRALSGPQDARALLSGLVSYAEEAAAAGVAAERPPGDPPFPEAYLRAALRRGAFLVDRSLAEGRLSYLGATALELIVRPLVEVYAPAVKTRPAEWVAWVSYELCMHALPFVALAAPRTAEAVWRSLLGRSLTLESFPSAPPSLGETDRVHLETGRVLLRIARAFREKPQWAHEIVLRAPKRVEAGLREAARAFGYDLIAEAFDRAPSADLVYRAATVGEAVLLRPLHGGGESNVPGLIRRLRERAERRRRNSSRKGRGETAALLGELKKFTGGERPLSGSRES